MTVTVTCRQNAEGNFRYDVHQTRRVSMNLPALEAEICLRQLGLHAEAAQILSDARYEWVRRQVQYEP